MITRFIAGALVAVVLLANGALFGASFETKKDPGSVEDFTWDWTRETTLRSTSISASAWTVPSGIVRVSDTFTSSKAIIRLSGGTVKMSYQVTNTVTLADGEVLVVSILIHVESA